MRNHLLDKSLLFDMAPIPPLVQWLLQAFSKMLSRGSTVSNQRQHMWTMLMDRPKKTRMHSSLKGSCQDLRTNLPFLPTQSRDCDCRISSLIHALQRGWQCLTAHHPSVLLRLKIAREQPATVYAVTGQSSRLCSTSIPARAGLLWQPDSDSFSSHWLEQI